MLVIVAPIAPVIVPDIALKPSENPSGFACKLSNADVAAPTGSAPKAPAIIAGAIPISATFIEAKLPGSKVFTSKVPAPETAVISTIPEAAKPCIAVPIPIPCESRAPIIPFVSNPAFSIAAIWPAIF